MSAITVKWESIGVMSMSKSLGSQNRDRREILEIYGIRELYTHSLPRRGFHNVLLDSYSNSTILN
jgi:hypothetical protein